MNEIRGFLDKARRSLRAAERRSFLEVAAGYLERLSHGEGGEGGEA